MFSNGQSVYVTQRGQLYVYTPEIGMDTIVTPNTFKLSVYYADGMSDPDYKLKLGDNNNVGAMKYYIYYETIFDGTGRITQLCQLNYSGLGNWNFSDYRLDGGESYEDTNVYSIPVPSVINLEDGPWNVDTLPNRLAGNFTDFIRFRPNAGNPNDNIFVTLGKVTWGMNATATSSTNIVPPTITGPTGPDNSSDFPFWVRTRQ